METIYFRLSRQELGLRLIQDLNHKYPNFQLFKNDSFYLFIIVYIIILPYLLRYILMFIINHHSSIFININEYS